MTQRLNILEIALSELGQREIAGGANNARIVEYHSATSLRASNDETPWCSSFANWVCIQAGITGTNNAMARSWLAWGVETKYPVPGCVAVLKRGTPPSGHVAFYLGKSRAGFIYLLGGNQGDAVSIKEYSVADVLSYRLPLEGK